LPSLLGLAEWPGKYGLFCNLTPQMVWEKKVSENASDWRKSLDTSGRSSPFESMRGGFNNISDL
jgi:hypothetical protein